MRAGSQSPRSADGVRSALLAFEALPWDLPRNILLGDAREPIRIGLLIIKELHVLRRRCGGPRSRPISAPPSPADQNPRGAKIAPKQRPKHVRKGPSRSQKTARRARCRAPCVGSSFPEVLRVARAKKCAKRFLDKHRLDMYDGSISGRLTGH